MRIALVRPNIGRLEHSLFVDEARMEPLELAVLAGLTPDEHEVILFDDRVEEIDYDAPVDLAALTVQTFTARRAYEICAEYRKRGVPVVIGGMQAALDPDEAAAHADAIVTGDAEFVWTDLLADAEQQRLKPRYDCSIGIPHPNTIPNRAIYTGRKYLPITLLQFGRGCTSRCRSAYNSPTSILRRAFDLKTNMRSLLKLGIYALYAPLFRKETFKKQGMRLGLQDED